jgi:hypothetical protein
MRVGDRPGVPDIPRQAVCQGVRSWISVVDARPGMSRRVWKRRWVRCRSSRISPAVWTWPGSLTGSAVELGWLFREQPTEDYGIDAHVEIVEHDDVRGRLLALQIKSGESWFRESGPSGRWFRPDAEHVQYWLNHSLPVVVVLYHPVTKRCHWQLVNRKTLQERHPRAAGSQPPPARY